jgi:hypothetical protein
MKWMPIAASGIRTLGKRAAPGNFDFCDTVFE